MVLGYVNQKNKRMWITVFLLVPPQVATITEKSIKFCGSFLVWTCASRVFMQSFLDVVVKGYVPFFGARRHIVLIV